MNQPQESDDLFVRIWDAEIMENGQAKCALLEEIVRIADVRQDVEAGFQARDALIQAAAFSGNHDKALVAFSWCLAQSDKDPDEYPEYDLLWKYKWIVNFLVGFPQISKKQLDDMLEDMRRRYERCGVGESAVLMTRWKRALAAGEKKDLRKFYLQWKQHPRDAMSDCHACEQHQEVKYAAFMGKDEVALELAHPLLHGQLRCAEVPHVTHGQLLLPLVRLKKLEDAARQHRIGYRLVNRNPSFLETIAEHLTFLALTDNLARANKLFEKHLIWALESPDLDNRFRFYLASQFLMERLREAGTSSIKARLPRALPIYQEKGRYEVDDLHAWFAEEAKGLAELFDRRNENRFYGSQIKGLKKLHALATAYPLT